MSSIADRIRANRAAVDQESALPPAPPEKKPLPPAEPCPTCRGPGFWIDAYHGVHCLACKPPRTPALARKKILVCENADGSFYWESLAPEPKEKISRPQEVASIVRREISFADRHRIECYDRLDRSCFNLTEEQTAAKVREWNDHILAVQGGLLSDLKVGRQREKPPKPPAGARLWYILADGRHVEASSKKATEKNPPVMWTYEGAPTWWYYESTEVG